MSGVSEVAPTQISDKAATEGAVATDEEKAKTSPAKKRVSWADEKAAPVPEVMGTSVEDIDMGAGTETNPRRMSTSPGYVGQIPRGGCWMSACPLFPVVCWQCYLIRKQGRDKFEILLSCGGVCCIPAPVGQAPNVFNRMGDSDIFTDSRYLVESPKDAGDHSENHGHTATVLNSRFMRGLYSPFAVPVWFCHRCCC
eukprot:gnl/TRDRNA2_/TRDRNA2_61190_c0_seq1.p1 gnl/TRDRNA2_/TRDRNA2_61190_c0~~gnl/TRDRNA2_/TRDRNA2_61190_c0_seq1.p1  ORF type:complete len:197 (+),score=18.76 gnl/TRDRNA2_/TRDRNA2_61190_c0_seq1:62-652(+)